MRRLTRVTHIRSRLGAADYFKRYRREKPQAVREIKVEEDQTLKQITEAWKKFKPGLNEGKARTKAKELLSNIRFTAKDIEKFSLALEAFQDEKNFEWKAGYFLSVLISCCNDNDLTIHTYHLSVRINCPAYRNTKNVTINGDVGIRIGDNMTQGRIIVKGNCGAYLGSNMKGGTVIVEGDVGSWAAVGMKGGVLHFNGDRTGFSKLFLRFSKYPQLDKVKIYHKGKLIWPERSDTNDE